MTKWIISFAVLLATYSTNDIFFKWRILQMTYSLNDVFFTCDKMTYFIYPSLWRATFKHNLFFKHHSILWVQSNTAQLAEAMEYVECISVLDMTRMIWWSDFSLEFWRMWSTPSLPLLPGLLWPGVLLPVRVPSMNQILIFFTWNHLTA